jgi:hypothetical protein
MKRQLLAKNGMRQAVRLLGVGLLGVMLGPIPRAQDAKQPAIRGGASVSAGRTRPDIFRSVSVGGGGRRFEISQGDRPIPVVVVAGTPYQMGYHLGRLTRAEIHTFLPRVLAGFKAALGVDDAELARVWATTAAYTDDRVEQELLGVAAGSGISLTLLQQVQCFPLLMPYSCSSIAAWGKATPDGHLYQTRDLDWSLEAKAHEFPVIVVYLPQQGHPHVVPSFAGFIGAHCGMNAAGITLAEMGDSPGKEAPYELRAPHFTTWFRSLLYDADSLDQALDLFRAQPMTKRYHFVFGDGQTDRRAVKIRLHSPEPPDRQLRTWRDNDPTDELAPNVLPNVVYQDEGRGAFPFLKKHYGRLDGPTMMQLAQSIPIRGGNVVDVVFDATALRLWVAYAHGDKEAYQMPVAFLALRKLDSDHDGKGDLKEGAADRNGNGTPDFLDPQVH